MTVQTCCGGISSEDQNMKRGRMPYMIRNCYSDQEQWSLSSCQENCCDENRYDGGSKGQCVATQDGGYCTYRDRYWRYERDGSQTLFPESDTRSLQKYPSDFKDVQNVEDLTIDKYYKRRLYDSTRQKVIRDLLNEEMDRRVLSQQTYGPQYSQEQARNKPDSIYEEITGHHISIAIIICVCLISSLAFILAR